jgi:intein/homing endonuclease
MDTQELASIILNQTASDNPVRYANIIRASRSIEIEQLRELLPTMREQLEKYEQITKQAKEFKKQVSGEGYARRRKDAKKMFDGLDKQADNMVVSSIDISSIVASHYENITTIYSALVQGSEYLASTKMVSLSETLSKWSGQISSSAGELGEDRVKALFDTLNSGTDDAIKNLALEQQINKGATGAFLQGISTLEKVPKLFEQYLQTQARNFENYYEKLRHRHSNGMVVCNYGDAPSPTLTDASLLIWENLDKVGEIESGHSPNELSAYTVHRAHALVQAAKYEEVWSWITYPGQQMIRWAALAMPTMESVLKLLIKLKQTLGEPVWKLSAVDLKKLHKDFEDVIESLDISQISQRPPERAFSKTEKFALEHQNKSIQSVANLLCNGEGIKSIVDEILRLKVEERNFFVLENSFYVCRIGTGNMFTGEAPGAIEIIPGEKPNANLENIWGGGFDEVKTFIAGMDEAKKWNPLFLATSPSKSTDKANVLLVGPQGCGKCVVGNTLIFTDKGLKSILELQPGKSDSDGYHPLNVGVRSVNGMTRSSHFYDSGVQPCIKIKDRFGFEIEGTGKHRVIVATDNGPDWKRLDEIQEGDYVALVREGLPTGSIPTNPDKSYILGYYVGDGNGEYNKHGNYKSMNITVGEQDWDYFNKNVVSLISKHFCDPKVYKYENQAYSVRAMKLSQDDKDILASCGRLAANKVVPNLILESDRESWKGFLSGLFDSDGSGYSSRIELGSNSKTLLNQVQMMLTAFGIISSVQPRSDKAWRLFIYGEDARIFYSKIGFRIPRKQEQSKSLNTKTNHNFDQVPVSKNLWKNLKLESGELPRSTHKKLWNYSSGKALPSREKLKELISLLTVSDNSKRIIDSLSSTQYRWSKIVSVENTGDKPVYDLVVPEAESFAANGMMNHNTEILRALSSDPDSIAIFAVGSDFLTCWLGEAQKNPKRLFDEAIKLHKASGRPVYILIDEIDMVLNDDQSTSKINLSLEFQNLMDGVVAYPGISVWGATNHPKRIPTPMLRRFAKVMVVGELTQEDSIAVLKHYIETYLPHSGLSDDDYIGWAKQLDGATGDVLRKVVDEIWLSLMRGFISSHAEQAETILGFIHGKYGVTFEVSDLTTEDRDTIKSMIAETGTTVTPDVISQFVNKTLDNFAVQQQIKVAKDTYRNAKLLLAKQKAGDIGVGF